MPILRIQQGHYARTRGVVGTQSPHFNWTEQQMNVELSLAIKTAAKAYPTLDVEIVGADEQKGGKPDVFIALHMDGADATYARGGSFGHNGTTNSKNFVAVLKKAYQGLVLPSSLRGDNYTTGLSKYYGYRSGYAGWGSGPKIVFENGFLTNRDDARWAKDNQNRVAQVIVASVVQYLKLTPQVVEPAKPLDRSDWYKIIASATGRVPSTAVYLLQERLNVWGYTVGVDGLIGPQTEGAFQEWAYDHLLGTTSVATSGKRPGPGAWAKILGEPQRAIIKNFVIEKAPSVPPNTNSLFEARITALEAEVEKYKRQLVGAINETDEMIQILRAIQDLTGEIQGLVGEAGDV